jgi:hypothetical protein
MRSSAMRRSNKKQATVEDWWMEGILGCGSLVTMIMSRCFVGLTGTRVGGKIGVGWDAVPAD